MAAAGPAPRNLRQRLRWADLYREAELYKAAVRLYTTPLFTWQKALSTSTDHKTLYDFARRGLQNLDAIHGSLTRQAFRFRPGIALHYNFNGKQRTVYLYPWEERLVDLLLYRMLNRSLHDWFSCHSYAYRLGGLGLDFCQRRIASTLRSHRGPLYVMKRDITDYFASIDHSLLSAKLAELVEPRDYLFQLLRDRIDFVFQDGRETVTASRGVPFGTAIACLFANVYLTEIDHGLSHIPDVSLFRYADDLLLICPSRQTALDALFRLELMLTQHHLRSNPRHHQDLLFCTGTGADNRFRPATKIRHLGLEFRASGEIGLSRDKLRKIRNIFRFVFRRRQASFKRIEDPESRAKRAIELARGTIHNGVRNVAIIDYYLKHVNDEKQLSLLDRWLAEEVLALAFQRGHKRGLFRRLSYRRLRELGLPSLVHRRRLIRHRRIESPFFIWKSYKKSKGSNGAAAKPYARNIRLGPEAFSPHPVAAAVTTLREREGLPVDGRY